MVAAGSLASIDEIFSVLMKFFNGVFILSAFFQCKFAKAGSSKNILMRSCPGICIRME
jgi:hypothetical protein